MRPVPPKRRAGTAHASQTLLLTKEGRGGQSDADLEELDAVPEPWRLDVHRLALRARGRPSVEPIVETPSAGALARFYGPLAGTSLLLTVTNPILTGALARVHNASAALSGFGVAFALTGVLYAPLLVVQPVAATRILQGLDPAHVRRLAMALGGALSAIAVLLAFSGVGLHLLRTGVGLRGQTLIEARSAMQVLWPVPILTALRSLHQGRLVAGRHTAPIALATALRTMALAGVAAFLAMRSRGAWLAGAAFPLGLTVETTTVALAPAGAKAGLRSRGRERATPLANLSGPLVLNVVLWWATPLLITSVLARTPDAGLAIATFVVVEATGWFLAAPVGQLQNASIAWVDSVEAYRRVGMFALAIALCTTAVLVVLTLPAFREQVLWSWFHLDPGLMGPSLRAFPLTVGYPLLYAYRQYHQGLFVRVGHTGPVGRGAALRILVILAGGVALLHPLGTGGARFGIGLAVAGLFAEDAYLTLMCKRHALPRLRRRGAAGPDT